MSPAATLAWPVKRSFPLDNCKCWIVFWTAKYKLDTHMELRTTLCDNNRPLWTTI